MVNNPALIIDAEGSVANQRCLQVLTIDDNFNGAQIEVESTNYKIDPDIDEQSSNGSQILPNDSTPENKENWQLGHLSYSDQSDEAVDGTQPQRLITVFAVSFFYIHQMETIYIKWTKFLFVSRIKAIYMKRIL